MISLIVAVANNGVIGNAGTLPWSIPEDMKYFKTVTAGKPVIMGRNTWESIPPKFRPLPGRENIVVSTTWSADDFRASGAHKQVQNVHGVGNYFTSLAEEAFVIGGAKLYEAMMPWTQRAYVTHIHADITGDTFFHLPSDFVLKSERKAETRDDVVFAVYERTL